MKNWYKIELSKIAKVLAGYAWKSEFYSDNPEIGVPIIRIQNLGLNDNAKLIYYTGEIVNGYWIESGEILISLSGSFKAFRWNGPKALLNQRIVVIRPNKEINISFLFRQLSYRLDEIQHAAMGIAVANASMGTIKDMIINVPPMSEQERIVRILDEVEGMKHLRNEADKRILDLIPSLFNDIPNELEIKECSILDLLNEKYLLLHKDGNFGGLYPRAEDFSDKGVPFITAKSISDTGELIHTQIQWLKEEKAKLLKFGWIEKDDVLLAHNASVGKVCHYKGNYERALIGTSLTAFRPNQEKLLPEYLSTYFKSPFFQMQLKQIMKQALRNQVPITAQKNLIVKVPNKKGQRAFADKVVEIENIFPNQIKSMRLIENLFKVTLQNAFEGKL